MTCQRFLVHITVCHYEYRQVGQFITCLLFLFILVWRFWSVHIVLLNMLFWLNRRCFAWNLILIVYWLWVYFFSIIRQPLLCDNFIYNIVAIPLRNHILGTWSCFPLLTEVASVSFHISWEIDMSRFIYTCHLSPIKSVALQKGSFSVGTRDNDAYISRKFGRCVSFIFFAASDTRELVIDAMALLLF